VSGCLVRHEFDERLTPVVDHVLTELGDAVVSGLAWFLLGGGPRWTQNHQSRHSLSVRSPTARIMKRGSA
jgi:hypothetical protein